MLLTDSLSGSNPRYLAALKRAVTPEGFKNFRRDPFYQEVLEHVTTEQGLAYYREVLPQYQSIQVIEEVSKNDYIGGPTRNIHHPTLLSPTTLRYLKVASDLKKIFGSLDGFRIVEIGVGYGGQCRILDALFKLKSYTLIDIGPALELTAMYLGDFQMNSPISYFEAGDSSRRCFDLVISNYAFSELSGEAQQFYLDNVLGTSYRGYLTYNNLTIEDFNSFTAGEIAERFSGELQPEIPLTHEGNIIVTWGA